MKKFSSPDTFLSSFQETLEAPAVKSKNFDVRRRVFYSIKLKI